MTRAGSMLRAATMSAALAAGALAQADGDRNPELQRQQRALQQNRNELDRLLELRLRHDFGLGPAKENDDRTFRPAAPATTEAMERMQLELRDEEAATETMLDRYNKLRIAVERLRADADARARAEAPEAAFVTVPVAGQRASAKLPAKVLPGPAATNAAATADPAPAGETTNAPAAVDPVAFEAMLDPMQAQIHGSTDHQRVAHALLKAGQALMDRAAASRERHQDTVARQFDERGKERLRRALDELAPLLAAKEPPLDALFHQGKALELLFRNSERNENLNPAASTLDWQRREQEVREPFLKITARDVKKAGARGESEVLGAWGMAAQAALEHFRWMNLHAAYDARGTIEALTWPGEKDQ